MCHQSAVPVGRRQRDRDRCIIACSPALCCCGKHQLRCCHLLGDKGRGIGNAMLPRPVCNAMRVLWCAELMCLLREHLLCCRVLPFVALRFAAWQCGVATAAVPGPLTGIDASHVREVLRNARGRSVEAEELYPPSRNAAVVHVRTSVLANANHSTKLMGSRCSGASQPARVNRGGLLSGVTGTCWLSCVDGVCMHGLTRKFRV